MNKLCLLLSTSFLIVSNAPAQTTTGWTGSGGDTLWSNAANWDNGIPNSSNFEAAYFGGSDVTIDVDSDFTIRNYLDGFDGAGATTTIGGSGNLTIDRGITQAGIVNATGNAGGTLNFSGNVIINNSGGGTWARNDNSDGNIMRFDSGGSLTLLTALELSGGNGAFELNGTLAPSTGSLIINANNVSFGAGHDSSAFGKDIVYYSNRKLAVDGGTVLNTGRKFQVNGDNSELELNAADTINDANLVVGGTNTFLLDVNADQLDMGSLVDIGGTLTIDLDPTVTELAFNDSSANEAAWAGGSVTIVNFRNKVIRFGTDVNGLTAAQLVAFGAGFVLDADGYLQNNSFPDPTVINVSLEMSTDLINWMPADEGAYLLYPDEELFFRARAEPAP